MKATLTTLPAVHEPASHYFHWAEMNMFYFPRLVVKGHLSLLEVFLFFPGVLTKWRILSRCCVGLCFLSWRQHRAGVCRSTFCPKRICRMIFFQGLSKTGSPRIIRVCRRVWFGQKVRHVRNTHPNTLNMLNSGSPIFQPFYATLFPASCSHW